MFSWLNHFLGNQPIVSVLDIVIVWAVISPLFNLLEKQGQ